MRRFLFAAAAVLALVCPARAQDSLDVPFRFVPDLSGPSGTVAQVFLPGAFNGWGSPYVSGTAGARIANTHPSKMAYDAGTNEYRKTVRLRVGSVYQYKVQVQRDAVESSTNFFWAADPLNPVVVAPDGNSQITVADPMVFQLAREQEGGGAIAAVSATIAGSQAITALTFEVNGVVRDGLASYDAATRLFRYVLPSPVAPGSQFKVTATDALGRTATATVGTIPPTVPKQPRPAGLQDGITYSPDGTSVTFSLYAPGKSYVYLLGDFNNWTTTDAGLMRKDSTRADSTWFWLTVSGLTPGREYGMQYFVDGLIRVADPYVAKVLMPGDDSFLGYTPTPAYPTGKTTGPVGVVHPGRPAFAWTDQDFQRPAPKDLVIYELQLRDFVGTHNFATLRDTLGYLKRLGVNAIELMPVSEFDGNLSWGYNPAFHLALDKYYGTPEQFKAFVNEAHRQGIAVLLDVVYNHATGQSPLIRLWNTSATGDPSGTPRSDNPYANTTAPHPFSVFNDLNHLSPATQRWLDAANRWWMEEYHIDGYRYDLTGGFIQSGNFFGYNQQRINTLNRMAGKIFARDPKALLIYENLIDGPGDTDEYRALTTFGQAQGYANPMVWINVNHAFNEATMGYHASGGSNFARAYYGSGGVGLTVPGAVSYSHSHDEQWLMLKNRKFGAVNATTGYSARDLFTALERHKAMAAFQLTLPGPKMLWQFEELGYGGGPRECLVNDQNNCLATDPGRTDAKPIRWDYWAPVAPGPNLGGATVTPTSEAERAERRRLQGVYSALLALRKAQPVFTSPATQVTLDLGRADGLKRVVLRGTGANGQPLDVVVVANFGTADGSIAPGFPATGTWHEYFAGRTVTIADANAPLLLAPGTFRLFTSQDVGYAPAGLTTTGIERDETAAAPLATAVERVWPNPALAGDVRVRYAVPTTGTVRVELFDVLGRRVATLADAVQTAGAYTATFDPADLAAGTYVVRVTTAQGTAAAPFVRTR